MKNTMKNSKEYFMFLKGTLVENTKSLEETHIRKEMTYLTLHIYATLKRYNKDKRKKSRGQRKPN